MTLKHQITIAFSVLALMIIIASGVGLYYLGNIHRYQEQVVHEWREYQRVVGTEDVLDELLADMSVWAARPVPAEDLKLRAERLKETLSAWRDSERGESPMDERSDHERREERLREPAEAMLDRLIAALTNLQHNRASSFVVLTSLSIRAAKQAILPLRQFYFKSMQSALGKAQKTRKKTLRNAIIFTVLVILLVCGISVYSIGILHGQAKQLMEQERQLASVALVQNLIHEVRNPLGIIKSAASVIAQRVEGETKTLTQDIASEVMRVDNLLSDLLRLRRGGQEPKVATDLAAMVVKISELFAPKVRAADMRLEVYNKAPAGSLCSCRPEAIKQVLMNLILNAIEASPQNSAIKLTTDVHGKEYMLQVRDYGRGLTAAQRQKIFELFYTTKPYGFGIGLTIVKRIVDDHNGRIEVTNPSPQGTAFTVYLPMG